MSESQDAEPPWLGRSVVIDFLVNLCPDRPDSEESTFSGCKSGVFKHRIGIVHDLKIILREITDQRRQKLGVVQDFLLQR